MNAGTKPGVHILCKLEGCNPGGSVKDRPALSMIADAEERGELTPGKVILEPTSGNTGIAIAMIGAAKGYARAALHARVRERRAGADPAGARRGALAHPGQGGHRRRHPRGAPAGRAGARSATTCPTSTRTRTTSWRTCETTGPEIWEQTAGEVDYFVAGMGTTGTLMGTGRYLKSVKPEVQHRRRGARDGPRHPGTQEHDRVHGAGHLLAGRAGRPPARSTTTRPSTRRGYLARREGLFVGSSAGAAVAVARTIAAEIDEGTIVVLLPDRGDRYLSTMQFRSICAKCPA